MPEPLKEVPEAARARIEQSRACRDFEALKEMRAARDAEAATADRTAQLYDATLRWALGVEAEAARAGVPSQDYLSRGSGADHALWLAVATHRERYPASAGQAAVREHDASAQSPSLRPWAPVCEVSLRLGSAAETLALLADLTDDWVSGGFLAGPVARVEALAYRDAVRAGLAALREDGRVYRRTYRVLEDLAVARRVHDPELGRAADVLLDQLAHRLVDDAWASSPWARVSSPSERSAVPVSLTMRSSSFVTSSAYSTANALLACSARSIPPRPVMSKLAAVAASCRPLLQSWAWTTSPRSPKRTTQDSHRSCDRKPRWIGLPPGTSSKWSRSVTVLSSP